MPAPLAAAGYRGIVQMLAHASRGSYRGPAVPADVLARALSSTEGLDPAQLVAHTRAAVGVSSTSGVRGELMDTVFTFLSQAAFGEILGRVADNVSDWFNNRDDSEGIAQGAEDAGEALRDIEDVADSGIEEIVFALRAVITQLCAFLNQVDPAAHPREFTECVAAGAELIDSAGNTILDCCRDRDTAVASCLDEFLARGTTVCEQPASCARTDVVCAGGDPAPAPAPLSAVPPPQVPAQESPTVPQSVEPAPEAPDSPEPPAPPNKPLEQTTVPQAVEPAPEASDSPEPPAPPKKPLEPPPSETGDAPTADCCGILGLVGAGVALLGIGLVVSALEECAPAPEPAPAPMPEPAPEPPPPPKQNLADVPEPPPPPKQNLADVPEPPPPPKQNLAPVQTPAPAPVPEPQPVSAQGGARKAGEW